jgi:hypothetical protein
MALDDFTAFLEGLDAPIRSKDDLDEFPNIGRVFLLQGSDLDLAADLLMDKLAEDDLRAVQPLVEIRCTRAIPAFAERAASSPSPTMRNRAAWAIEELSTDRGLPALVERLRGGDLDTRLQAVFDLNDLDDPAADRAAETAAFTDPDPLIRNAALDVLLAKRGLFLDDEPFRSMLDFVRRRMLSPLPTVRAEAEAELRHLLARWAAGESREQLGLARRADQEEGTLKEFVLSKFGDTPVEESRRYQEWQTSGADISELRRPRPPVHLARLAGLTGWERKWLEDVLLSELHREREAVAAVAQLGVRRAVQPLRELLTIDSEVPVADVENALRHLLR